MGPISSCFQINIIIISILRDTLLNYVNSIWESTLTAIVIPCETQHKHKLTDQILNYPYVGELIK
jgi:hypothetical protein